MSSAQEPSQQRHAVVPASQYRHALPSEPGVHRWGRLPGYAREASPTGQPPSVSRFPGHGEADAFQVIKTHINVCSVATFIGLTEPPGLTASPRG